jgi:beta-glucanase (GH16 family)
MNPPRFRTAIISLGFALALAACGQEPQQASTPVDAETQIGLNAQALGTNLALNRPISASSFEDGRTDGPYRAALANDGNSSTRWASQHKTENQWLTVDLGSVQPIGNVGIVWEAAYATSYRIDLANDLNSWRNNVKAVSKTKHSKGAEDVVTIPAGSSTRYVRIWGLTRALQAYGYSIHELRVYGADNTGGGGTGGVLPTGPGTKISSNKRAYASTTQDGSTPTSNAIDGSLTTRWSSGSTERAWLMIDLGAAARVDRVEIDWERAWSSKYTLEASNDLKVWTAVGAAQTNPTVKDTVTPKPAAAEFHDVIALNLTQAYRYIRINSSERGWSAGDGRKYGVSLFEFAVFGAGGQDNPTGGLTDPLEPTGNYSQVWADEFESNATKTKPDPSKWVYDLGDGCDRGLCGWGNGEREFYTDSLDNVYRQNGNLNIELRKNHLGRNYTSGRINTLGKYDFTYGKVTGRIKMNTPTSSSPGAKDGPVAVWGAFWMLGIDVNDPYVGWPNSGEIDIMESIGYSWWFSSSLHGPGYSGGASIGESYNKLDNPFRIGAFQNFKSTDWHEYEVEWHRDQILFKVDGVVFRTINRPEVEARGNWVFGKPNFLILNLAYDGGYPAAYRNQAALYSGAKAANGLPVVAEDSFPHSMQVDYVRVFQRGAGGGTGVQPTTPTLQSIAVTPNAASITNGATQQFNAIGSYSDTSSKNLTTAVTWRSSSAGVASINAQGLATGIGAGSSGIVATLGSVSSPAITLNVSGGGTTSSGAPSITTQPAGQTVTVGQHALFNVTASGASTYQWKKNGTAIGGANGSSYYTGALQSGDAGAAYSVTVSNGSGSVESSAETISINPAADGSPPSSFWGNPSSLPVASKVMTYSFLNRTNGKYPDSQVFWKIEGKTTSGASILEIHSIAEKPTFDLPAMSSARMYFYLAPNASSINNGPNSYYDFIEYNIGQDKTTGVYSFYGNTTRVDAFGLKHAIRLVCGDGKDVVRGEDYGTFLEDRSITFQKYLAEVPAEFAATATKNAPYRILEPGAAGFSPGGVNANYFRSYVDQVWANNNIDEKIVPKPAPFMNFKDGNITDLNAALQRHVAEQPGTFTSAGKLVNPNFWQTKPASSFYQGGAGNYYAKFWHAHGIGGYAYGFPYDDVGSYSTYVTCAKPKSLSVAIGW